jgi:PAS domain S-box-containing protein
MLLVLLLIAPILGIEIANNIYLRNERVAAVHHQAEHLAALVDDEHARISEGIRQLLSTWAESPVLRTRDMAACQEMAERLRMNYPAYLVVGATEETAVVQCATSPTARGLPIGDRPHIRLARETGSFAIGEYIRSRNQGRPALSFALPYRDETGARVGFITALMDLGWLDDFLVRKPLPAGASITIADRQGTVLARVPEVTGVVGKPLPDAYLPLLEATVGGSVELIGLDGVVRVQGYSPPAVGTQGLLIMAGLDKAAALAPIHGTMLRSLGVLGAATLLALIALWWGARRYLRDPVQTLVVATERWREGDYAARANLTGGGSELVALGYAFNAMAQSLEAHDRAREEDHAAARKVAEVFDCMTDSVFEVDRDWRITFMNERARTQVAQGQDQVGRNLWEAYPEGANTRMWTAYHRAMAERVAIEVEDYYPPHRKWYRFRAFPSREGLAFYGQDITAHRRLQEDLEHQRALLETIIESTPDPVFTKDREGRYLSMNSAAAQVIGRDRHTIAGLMDEDILPPEAAEELRGKDTRIMLTGGTEVTEERIPDLHLGEDRVFLTTRTSMTNSEGLVIGIIGISRDITRRKMAEEKLRQARDEAERANLAKSKFLAAASHDLRQPLQSLVLFAGVLKGYVEGARGQQALKQLENGLGTLKDLLDSLLDVSQLDAGIVKPEITDFPISAVLDGVTASYAPVAAAKGLTWQVEPCTETVRTDMTLLGRVLRNLIENAIRYTSSGHIRIICRRSEDRLSIEVEDTGIGIPPEQLDCIFEEFHQVGNHARDRTQGLGLGLAIVRRIADLLGHRIATRSRPGQGSTFSIELPLALPQAAGLPVPRDAGSEQNGHGRFVVVIDDDTMVLESLEAILTEWGYQTLTATNAEEAIARVRKLSRRPDILIADYRLRDGHTGTEAVLAIRTLFNHPIPGLILTGETDLRFLHECAGHDLGIAHKPVMPSQLGHALDQQLNAAA